MQEGAVVRRIAAPAGPTRRRSSPSARRAEAGRALFVGLATDDPEVRLLNRLTLGVAVAAPPGAPPPVPAGGVAPLPVPPPPLLRWELLDGGVLEAARGVARRDGRPRAQRRDRARAAARAGGRAACRAGTDAAALAAPAASSSAAIRSRPSLRAILLNVAPAIAARTIRDEALELVPDTAGRQYRVAQAPVLPRSLCVEVDEGSAPGATRRPTASADGGAAGAALGAGRRASPMPGPEDRACTCSIRPPACCSSATACTAPPCRRASATCARSSYQVGGGAAGRGRGRRRSPRRSRPRRSSPA